MEFTYEVVEESIVFGYGFGVGVSVLVGAVSDQLVWLCVEPFAETVDAVKILVKRALARAKTIHQMSEIDFVVSLKEKQTLLGFG